MARIDAIREIKMERNGVHAPVDATCCVFTDAEGQTYLQIDTYGSPDRQISGKKSQSLQFSPEGLRALRAVLEKL